MEPRQEFATLRTLIGRMKVAMLTTTTNAGELRSRPLHTLACDDDGTLWFFVSASSPKVHEIEHEYGHVGLSYADTGRQDYVSISGTGSLVRDRERMKKLWTPWARLWFPEGVDDPDLALLRVNIDAAEYWDAPGSSVRRLYGLAKARASGDLSSLGEHRKLRNTPTRH
jgi:general stress protein 26